MNQSSRHVVISGGSSGVGAAMAHAFATENCRVTILGRTESTLKSQGHAYQVCDVTDVDSVAQAINAARNDQGPIDVAIANAGAAISVPFAKMNADDIRTMTETNLVGVFNLWQAALADIKRATQGRLIATASTAGLKGYPYVSAYCAAKHGVIGLVRSLSLELASTDITVNAICPGFIETPMLQRSIDNIVDKTGQSAEQVEQSLKSTNPQRRFIETEEVAAAALWLCTDQARSINGQALSISGGEI